MGAEREGMNHIHVVEEISLTTTTFASLVANGPIDAKRFDALVISVRGAELLALQGFGDLLQRFDVVYVKVYLKHLYIGCGLLSEVDQYLTSFGFSRRETLISEHTFGDGLYLRDERFGARQADLAERVRGDRADFLAQRTFSYRINGKAERVLEFLEQDRIGDGKKAFEKSWLMRAAGHEILLEIIGDYGRTCYLIKGPDGVWCGRGVLPPFPTVELIAT
jgi:hypothetical protein